MPDRKYLQLVKLQFSTRLSRAKTANFSTRSSFLAFTSLVKTHEPLMTSREVAQTPAVAQLSRKEHKFTVVQSASVTTGWRGLEAAQMS